MAHEQLHFPFGTDVAAVHYVDKASSDRPAKPPTDQELNNAAVIASRPQPPTPPSVSLPVAAAPVAVAPETDAADAPAQPPLEIIGLPSTPRLTKKVR